VPIDPTKLDPRGLRLRRAVVGATHVSHALGQADQFTGPIQELITNDAWGKVWSRPGISLKTRSLVTIALLAAMNRPIELRLHIAGAIRNGCTLEEIRETLLHCSVYCGIPASVDALSIAGEVLATMKPQATGVNKAETRKKSPAVRS
jgi:4-carboxymuconolactone decarboxylase